MGFCQSKEDLVGEVFMPSIKKEMERVKRVQKKHVEKMQRLLLTWKGDGHYEICTIALLASGMRSYEFGGGMKVYGFADPSFLEHEHATFVAVELQQGGFQQGGFYCICNLGRTFVWQASTAQIRRRVLAYSCFPSMSQEALRTFLVG